MEFEWMRNREECDKEFQQQRYDLLEKRIVKLEYEARFVVDEPPYSPQ